MTQPNFSLHFFTYFKWFGHRLGTDNIVNNYEQSKYNPPPPPQDQNLKSILQKAVFGIITKI